MYLAVCKNLRLAKNLRIEIGIAHVTEFAGGKDSFDRLKSLANAGCARVASAQIVKTLRTQSGPTTASTTTKAYLLGSAIQCILSNSKTCGLFTLIHPPDLDPALATHPNDATRPIQTQYLAALRGRGLPRAEARHRTLRAAQVPQADHAIVPARHELVLAGSGRDGDARGRRGVHERRGRRGEVCHGRAKVVLRHGAIS